MFILVARILIAPNVTFKWTKSLVFLVMATCGASVIQNGTYFVNPNHPNPTDSTGSCQITVPKLGPDVCQIR